MARHSKLIAAVALALFVASADDTASQAAVPGAAHPLTIIALAKLERVDDTQLLNGVPFSGTVVDFYPNGMRKARFQLVDGKASGAWVEWHPNGAIRFYSELQAGKGEGPFVYFHPNGEISERVTAHADIWDGVAEGWHQDGRKAFERVYRAGKMVSDRPLSDAAKD